MTYSYPTITATRQVAKTASGSTYEFQWPTPETPEHGPRAGRVRRNGGDWADILLISGYVAEGGRIAYIQPETERFTHTGIVVSLTEGDAE